MRLYNIYYLCKNSIKPIAELTGKPNPSNIVYTLKLAFLTIMLMKFLKYFPLINLKRKSRNYQILIMSCLCPKRNYL